MLGKVLRIIEGLGPRLLIKPVQISIRKLGVEPIRIYIQNLAAELGIVAPNFVDDRGLARMIPDKWHEGVGELRPFYSKERLWMGAKLHRERHEERLEIRIDLGNGRYHGPIP